ncbi:MAG: hypothetical protein ACYC8T_31640, partial [Myxococcaceae bacterium]
AMRALAQQWPPSDREGFEARVVRTVLAGALAGAVAMAAVWLGFRFWLPYLVVAFAAIANARGQRFDQVLLSVVGVMLPALPWVLGLSPTWRTVAQGALCGPLLVLARRCQLGAGEGLWTRPATGAQFLAAAALSGALYLLASRVALGALLPGLGGTHPLLAMIAAGAVFGLFLGLGTLPSHLGRGGHPLEEHLRAKLLPLEGALRELGERALRGYRRCAVLLESLPVSANREQLAEALEELTGKLVELAAEWSGIDGQLAEGEAGTHASPAWGALAGPADPLTRAQLERAAELDRERTADLVALSFARERAVARLRAGVAQLEGARIALLAVRGARVQQQAAALAQVAGRLSQSSHAQAEEAHAAGLAVAEAEAMRG